MDLLQFLDDNGDRYEFQFTFDGQDQEHYVDIRRHKPVPWGTSWCQYARKLNPETRTIDWDQGLITESSLTSNNARHYIEKVYKNKAFI